MVDRFGRLVEAQRIGPPRNRSGQVEMILFKWCPRCRGDRVFERDFYGCYVVCLYCGYVSYPAEREAAKAVDSSGHLARRMA